MNLFLHLVMMWIFIWRFEGHWQSSAEWSQNGINKR